MNAEGCLLEKGRPGAPGHILVGITDRWTAMDGNTEVRCGAMEVSGEGRIRWTAGEGAALLAAYCRRWDRGQKTLPASVQVWLTRRRGRPHRPWQTAAPTFCLGTSKNGALLCLRVIPNGRRWLLWLEELDGMNRRSGPAEASLTRREREVFDWMAQGKTNGEIGFILGISQRTVQKHAERIYEKLGVETRVAAIACCLGWKPASREPIRPICPKAKRAEWPSLIT